MTSRRKSLGYSQTEMTRIKRKIKERDNMWKYFFEQALDNMLTFHADTMRPTEVVRYCKDLADEIINVVEEHDMATGLV